ncbi:uncharacterized protein [Apostichopus japonicus]|uniref:uncharacterized protein isoform X2 n=1 Tax=Stichopus japonicus TaxID=307972 RepID=UPI003AB5A798
MTQPKYIFALHGCCFVQITTDIYPPVINFTGTSCTWKIKTSESDRVILTIERFTSHIIDNDNSCEVFLEVFDDFSSVSPICPGGQYPEYISDGDVLYLSLNSSHNTDMASVVARFRVAEDYYLCEFEPSTSCTQHVEEELLWGQQQQPDPAIECPRLEETNSLDLTGLFYQSGRETSTFNVSLTTAGSYLILFDILNICSASSKPPATLEMNLCEVSTKISIDSSYTIEKKYAKIAECRDNFNIILGPLMSVDAFSIIRLDNVRIMIITESVPPNEALSTIEPARSTLETGIDADYESDTKSGHHLSTLLIIVASSGVGFLVIVTVIVCACVLVCIRKRRSEVPSIDTKINFENQTYEIHYKLHPNLQLQQYQQTDDYQEIAQEYQL